MKELTKQIKEKSFHKVYLLTGDEPYLVLQAKHMLKNAMIKEGDTMNYAAFTDGKIDLNTLQELAFTYPFFSEKRLLLLDGTGILKTGKDEFVSIMENMPETTCIIICEPEVDKRSKVYKWIKKNGYVGEFLKKNQTEKVLLRWIAALLGKEKKQIRENNARYFLQKTGDDMFQIKNEIDKLIAYAGDREEITQADIDAVDTRHDRIESDIEQTVVTDDLKDQQGDEQNGQTNDLALAHGQHVTVKELLHGAGHARLAADNGQTESHDGRKDDADDRIRGKGTAPADGHDGQTHQHAERRHGPVRVNREQQAQSHTGKGRMPDGIGKEGHAEGDDLHSQGGCHGGEQQDGQQGLLHEAQLEAVQRQQGKHMADGGDIRHGAAPCLPCPQGPCAGRGTGRRTCCRRLQGVRTGWGKDGWARRTASSG